MKNHLRICFILVLFSTSVFSQWNGYMYWEMRQRFLDRFIRVGEGHGMSIPASWISRRVDGDNVVEVLHFEDESTRHIGWYLAMLATEHKLLKHHGYPTDQNEQEMYYAFKAINRLDGYAEFLWDASKPVNTDEIIWNQSEKKYEKTIDNTSFTDYTNTNLNGFMIREDVPPNFEELFDVHRPNRIYHAGGWVDEFSNQIIKKQKSVMSQDQFFHLMFGMFFVKKYMGGVSYNGMNFVNEAKAFCSRVMINYNGAYNLRNPVVNNDNEVNLSLNLEHGREVENEQGHNIGNSSMYAWFVATMADGFVEGVDYSPVRLIQLAQDLTNPFRFEPAFSLSRLAWEYLPQVFYPANSMASPNQIMLHLLICMSKAYGDIKSAEMLDMPDHNFHNPGYRFYATAFRLLHNYPHKVGYSKQEMQEMLSAMDCEGPYWYSKCLPPFVATDEEGAISASNGIPGSTVSEDKWPHGATKNWYVCWLGEKNPIWNRDNVFAQAPFEYFGDVWQSGHYNGIDFMLLHNIYQLLVIDEANGFDESADGEFEQNNAANIFCGGENCELTGTLPIVNQTAETKHYFDLNPFDDSPVWSWDLQEEYTQYGSVRQIGTEALPYIRSSTGEIKLNLKLVPLVKTTYTTTFDLNQEEPVIIQPSTNTYIPKVIIKASKDVIYGLDWLDDYNVYLDVLYSGSNKTCYANYYKQRLAEGASRLRYQIFDRTPGKKNPENKNQDADVQLFPNPAGDLLNFTFNAGGGDPMQSIHVYDISGRLVLSAGMKEQNNTYSISLAGLPAGVYSCSFQVGSKLVNKSFVKM
jgi:hypothetical protein